MKNKIIKLIEALGGEVSFVELMKLPGFTGDVDYWNHELNIIYWVGLSMEAFDALNEMVHEGIIEGIQVGILPYIVDGMILDLPMAKDEKRYDEPRWMPFLFYKR